MGDGAPPGHRLEVEDLLPVIRSVEDDRDLFVLALIGEAMAARQALRGEMVRAEIQRRGVTT